jgi:hypothetical protein
MKTKGPELPLAGGAGRAPPRRRRAPGTPARERVAAYRQRQREGLRVYKLTADAGLLEDILTGLGYLQPHQADDQKAIERGLAALLERLARNL